MTDRIEKNIELNASIDRVWRALTDHKEFGEWFRVNIDRPFVPGEVSRGRVIIPGYEHVAWEAKIVKMDRPRYFSYTWHPFAVEPGVDYSGEPSTLVEFRLEPTEMGTRLSVVESGFDALPSHRRDEAFRMNNAGWDGQTRNIKAYVEK